MQTAARRLLASALNSAFPLSHSVTHVSVFPLSVVVLCVCVRAVLLTHPWPWLGLKGGTAIFHYTEWDV